MDRFTVSALMERNNIDRDAATALAQYLRISGLAKNVGSVAKPEGQRGRGETIYEHDAAATKKHLSGLSV